MAVTLERLQTWAIILANVMDDIDQVDGHDDKTLEDFIYAFVSTLDELEWAIGRAEERGSKEDIEADEGWGEDGEYVELRVRDAHSKE